MTLIDFHLGDWIEYVRSLEAMLPYFAASGRDKYTKSIRWYLEELQHLPPEVSSQFTDEGLFVVNTTNQFYAGCSGDYTIETSLMASFKGKTGE